MLNQIVATLITVGGVGYVNYSVATQLNVIDTHASAKTQAIAYSSMWSVFDFAFFIALQNLLKHYLTGDWLLIVAMLLTIIFSFLSSIILMLPLKRLVYLLYNRVLKIGGHSSISSGTVWNHTMDSNDNPIMAYLYDFDHNPLGFGYVDESSNDEVSDYSLVLQPFNYHTPEPQDSYDTLEKRIQDNEFCKKYVTKQFIDFKQRFIVITIQEA